MSTPMQKLGEHLTREPASVLHLYELPDAFDAIEAELLENGGELTPELEARLEALEGTLETKAERICRVIRNNDASAKAFKDEMDRLGAHRQTHENVVKRLKGYLQSVLTRMGRDKLAAGMFKVAIQNNSRPSITWTGSMEDLPPGFKRVRIEMDGDAAYDAHRAAALPEGFEVVTGKHLRIR